MEGCKVTLPKPLTDEDRDILNALREQPPWVRPMDVGGTSSSRHSDILDKLYRRGLVDRQARKNINGTRTVRTYMINDAGLAEIPRP